MKRIKIFIVTILIVLYAFLLIKFSSAVSESVHNAVMTCLTTLIPSLFSFLIAADFILSTNLYKLFSKPFRFISRYIFRIPEELFSVFLLSSVAGYPVGARLVSKLVSEEKIDKKTASDMMRYCFLAGPAFICGIVGNRLYGSTKIGMIIFGIIFFSNIIVAVITGFHRKIPDKSNSKNDIDISTVKLVASVNSAAKGMFSVCIMVVFFSSLTCILNETNVIPFLADILAKSTGLCYNDSISLIKAFLEISNIKDITAQNIELLPICTAMLSFGGVCVVMQAESFIQNKFSTKSLYIGRAVSILISYMCSKIIIGVLDDYVSVFKLLNENVAVGYRQISPIPSVFLLIMTILLLSNNYIANSKEI